MKKGWNSIQVVVLTGLLALTVALSACGEGTVTEAVGSNSTETPTQTTNPTSTRTIRATPTYNFDQIRALERTATQSAYETIVAPFVGSCADIDFPNYFTLISPEGDFLAEGCDFDKFFVGSRDGRYYWEIRFDTLPEVPALFPGYCFARPLHWSNDSKYIYFHLYTCYEQSIISIHWYRIDQVPDELYVMDAFTGSWRQLTPRANLYSFSPTGRRLLYLSIDYIQLERSLINITVLDLQSGEEVNYLLTDYLVADYVVWSEDGTQAFLSAEQGLPVYYSEDPHTYSIYRIDMLSQTMNMVYTFPDSQDVIYTADYLDEENLLVLNSENYTTNTVETLYLDPNTGEIFDEPPTP